MTTTRILPDGDAARAEAVDLLRAGRIVAIPTDTVYGIAADLAFPDAIERLFAAKQRPPEKAVAVLLADVAQAWTLGQRDARGPGPRGRLLAGGPDPRPDGPARCPPAAGAGRRHAHHRRPRAGPPRAPGARRGPGSAADDLGQPVGPARRARRRRGGRHARRRGRAGHRRRPDPRRPWPRRWSTARPSAPRSCDRGRSNRSAVAAILDDAGIPHAMRLGPGQAAVRPARQPGEPGNPAAWDQVAPSPFPAIPRVPRRSASGRTEAPSAPAHALQADPPCPAAVSAAAWAPIAEVDPELWAAMEQERHRQADKIELIASENYVYAAVLEAQGSWLTNKYAEGLPGKRYYGGCEYVDIAENLARERALALFPGSEHVNVQPHSGAQANMAAYFSVLRPGDRILGMNLAHGGHLTHGSPVNFSGRLYEVHAYGVTREDRADRLRRPRGAGGRGASEGGRRRRIGLPADLGLRADGGDRPRRRRAAVRRHGPRRGPRGRGPAPEPVPARGPRDHHHPQDAARAARRDRVRAGRPARRRRPRRLPGPRQEHAGAGDRQVRVPGRPGRAADARRRGQGRRVPARGERRLPARPGPHDREREGPRARPWPTRAPASSAAAPTTTSRSST